MFNKSFTYLFPIIYKDITKQCNISYGYFFKNLLNYFYNCYCITNKGKKFTIVFKDLPKEEMFLEHISRYSNLHRCFIYENYTVIEIKIDKTLIVTYDKIINSKFSQLELKYKKEILYFITKLNNNIINGKELYNKIYNILNKPINAINEIKKEYGLKFFDQSWEITSKINQEQEMFHINKLE